MLRTLKRDIEKIRGGVEHIENLAFQINESFGLTEEVEVHIACVNEETGQRYAALRKFPADVHGDPIIPPGIQVIK